MCQTAVHGQTSLFIEFNTSTSMHPLLKDRLPYSEFAPIVTSLNVDCDVTEHRFRST